MTAMSDMPNVAGDQVADELVACARLLRMAFRGGNDRLSPKAGPS